MLKRVLVFWLTTIGVLMVVRDLATSKGRARVAQAYSAERAGVKREFDMKSRNSARNCAEEQE
jgi:hypothetical protein